MKRFLIRSVLAFFCGVCPMIPRITVAASAGGLEPKEVTTAAEVLEEEAAQTARELLEQSGVQGGLVVHAGCGEGRVTAALADGEAYLVHGLEEDPGRRERAREHVRSRGRYGSVAIGTWNGRHLPYAENLVNLLVVEQAVELCPDEILRVLAPRGVALQKQDGTWTKTVKPWPTELDEWTHYLHNPSNNAVAADAVVGPPRRVQWVSPPVWARSHEHLATLSAAVSAGGRLFSIIDQGPAADVTLPEQWQLIARDAFSGVLLWQRPLGTWEYRLRGFRSGPPDLARRLVAAGDRVYVTLGYGQPVKALSAATGETLQVYEQTEHAQEILLEEGVLYLVVGDRAPDPAVQARRAAESERVWHWWPIYEQPRPQTRLLAVEAASGRTLWERTGDEFAQVMPTTLAVADGRVFFQNTTHVVCLDAADGQSVWQAARPICRRRPAWTAPTLVVYDGVVLSADRGIRDSQQEDDPQAEVQWTVTSQGGISPPGELIAFSARDGQQLWSAPCREGYNAPVDVLVAGGLVWTGNLVGAGDPGIVAGRDPQTGEVQRRRPRDQEFYQPIMSHARCYRHKATDRYLITGRTGVEFVDVASGQALANHWVRGECQYGILPCNGLLYVPPHPCACFILAKLNSYHALASEPLPRADQEPGAEPRWERGPAFETVEPQPLSQGDWPTYRYGPERGSATPARVSADLAPAWQVSLPGPLSAPVSAGGRVLVASIDTHTVYARDADDGELLWHFTADSRVDSPPTIWNGRVLFGSADGWVYCLRATDGRLAWRYRVAPTDRLVTVHGQLESAWPVHGSVLVLDQGPDQAVVYASAGRSGYLDGGIVLARLDAQTGQELSRTWLDSRDPETGGQPHPLTRPAPGFSMPGNLNDILSAQHDSIFMRHQRFDREGQPQAETLPHLHSPAGFLDDSWWHRTYWVVGTEMHSGWGGWPTLGTQVPSGRLLVLGQDTVYGFGRDRYHRDGSHVGLGRAEYRLFARRLDAAPRRDADAHTFLWEQTVEPRVRAMVLSDERLFVAGPPDALTAQDPMAAWEGDAGGLLWVVDPETGERLAAYSLDAPPVFDGMIATPGKLLFTTTDGRLVCYTEQAKEAGVD